ncbi:phosphate-starvation-inducible PsiE family protein [Gloeocapsa sp. BRSZ]
MLKTSEKNTRYFYNWFDRERIVHSLELVQNLIVVLLCIGLFCTMLIRLGDMFISLLQPLRFQDITSDILFILILVELFRLLIIYLQEQRISVGVAVEVSIVSVLREVIIREVLEIPWQQILAVCAFLLVLALLLLTRAWMAKIFNTISLENNQTLTENAREHSLEKRVPI